MISSVCVWGGGRGRYHALNLTSVVNSQCSTTGVTKAVVCVILCGMVHIKEPLLLIEKNNPCGGGGFPISLSEWSFTIRLTPYNRK